MPPHYLLCIETRAPAPVLLQIAPLLGEHFILHSSWNTMVPAGSPGGGFHQDASGPSVFRQLATPAPLVYHHLHVLCLAADSTLT